MKQFVIEHLERVCASAEQISAYHHPAKDADLLIELRGGKRVAVYVVNRAIRVPEIIDGIERNTRKHLATLYLLDGRMMPENGSDIDPPVWMVTLHTLAHGRLYAYWCNKRDVAIRPVHLDWKWGVDVRNVHYGDAVNINWLRAETATYTSKLLTGRFIAADFGEGAFWKKPNILQDDHGKYTWRRWSFGSQRRRVQSEAEEREYAYNRWDEFEWYYGDIGSGPDYTYYRSRDQRKPFKRAQSPLARHYTVLGVDRNSSYEQVKKAYRSKARENHPDLHPSDKEKYTLKMVEINAAFDAISRLLKQTT